MFAAVMLIPPSFGVAVTAVGGYAIPDIALAVLAAISAALLCRGP
jgi:hypothetical protein